jgi:hypothetical protein
MRGSGSVGSLGRLLGGTERVVKKRKRVFCSSQERVRAQDTCYCAVAPRHNRGVVESIYATLGTDNDDVPSDNDYNENNNDCLSWELKEHGVQSLRPIKRKWSNVVHKRASHFRKQNAYATTSRNITTIHYTAGNRIVLFRSVAIFYILCFHLAGVGVMPSFTATAAASLCAHPLYRCLALLTTATLFFSD